MIVRLLLAVLCASCAQAAQAATADQPLLVPKSDVAVIYRLAGGDMGDSAQKLQATLIDGGKRTRLDFFRWAEAKYPYLTLIYDGFSDTQIKVMPERRAYIRQPAPPGPKPGEFLAGGGDQTYTRQGTAAIVGLSCTNWLIKTSNPSFDGAVACITDDGVLLRLVLPKSPGVPAMLAQAVQFASPPAAIFQPPADFDRVQPNQ